MADGWMQETGFIVLSCVWADVFLVMFVGIGL